MVDFTALQALLAGMGPSQTAAPAAVQPAAPFANVQNLLSGNITPMVRSIGGGMANIQAGNDPYVAFGQGFGGATNYSATAEADTAKLAQEAQQREYENHLALNKALMDQGQFDSRMSQDQSQFDARSSQDQQQFDDQMELRKSQEARQEKMDALEIKKTEAELRRMADSNGLTINQMLEIERIAQAEGENMISATERKAAVDAKRNELMMQFQTGGSTQSTSGVPSVGDVVDGYEFQGGDPNDPSRWTQQ